MSAYGFCAFCRERALLPDFGDGLCFACVSDGRNPDGSLSPVMRALGEGDDGRREELRECDDPDDPRAQIVTIFDEAQAMNPNGRPFTWADRLDLRPQLYRWLRDANPDRSKRPWVRVPCGLSISERFRLYARRHINKLRAEGLCLKCGREPVVDVTTRCRPCHDYNLAGTVARMARRADAGLCTVCGKRPQRHAPTRWGRCVECNAKRRKGASGVAER